MDALGIKRTIDEALRLATERYRAQPTDRALATIIDQLVYLQSAHDRDGDFGSVPAGKLTIGVIAARNFDTSDPPLASKLFEINYAIEHKELL
jgi:hypothetical protein